MSRCADAEREHGWTASPKWPMKIFHTIDIMLNLQMGLAGVRKLLALLGFYVVLNPLLAASSNFFWAVN